MANPQNQTRNEKQTMNTATLNWPEAESTRSDIKEMFGFYPTFMENYTDASLAGAWAEAKALRFGTSTALDMKLKSLMASAIGAQIPCDMLSYFEQRASEAEGATKQEQYEAVLMAAITRHWSCVLNGLQLDRVEFRKEADQIMAFVKKMMEDGKGILPPQEMFLFKPTTAEDAYKDMEKILGIVPKFFKMFPKEGIAGAWSEFKGLQLNPYSALSGKQKELIGLAVATQIPCEYCVYFHRSAAILNEASEREIQEAISLSALVRHWSTLFHGPQITFESFKRDADQMLKTQKEKRLQ